ncbi:MAG TPA: ParA family protein [Thermoanaerobaculia bacterium]|nr:ParA family protein [Thermoanaerobaculia bacterium]HUM29170.1 ParA family protein [Thermoanaerobaculia bacterium]HXK67548.1 ParA family protein [Thermoanaerobaculia bacterium]
MPIYTVSNQKGGVGKTTTAVNLAAELALLGKKILLVDIDPQANATTGLGFGKDEVHNVFTVLFNKVSIDDAIRETIVQNLYIVPANRDLVSAEINLHDLPDREYRLKTVLDGIQKSYDLIFLDTPPSLGLLTVNALAAADALLIPIQCEYYALEGLSDLVGTVDRVRGSLNPFLELAGIVLTMVDERTNLSQQVADEVRRYFPDRVFQSMIPRNVRLSECPSFGKPISLYDPRCKGAEAYRELALEFLQRRLA